MPRVVILIKLSCGASVLQICYFVAFFLATIWSAGQSNAQQVKTNNTPLRIAVASNFTPVLKELLHEFTKKTGINSQIISGASGAMFLQIKHGAPFDVFLSADSKRPEQLERDGFLLKKSRKTYAIGQLAIYCSVKKLFDCSPSGKVSREILNTPPKHFAIANPDIAPYGKAAKEALEYLGLWNIYEPRLIKGINIGQTFTQIRSKAVTSGIVANSQLILNDLSGLLIPTNFHHPIEQQLGIINTSKQIQNAKMLSAFILSPASQQRIVSYGYAPYSQMRTQKIITAERTTLSQKSTGNKND